MNTLMIDKMGSEEISLVHSCRLCLKSLHQGTPIVDIFGEDENSDSTIPLKIKTCVCIDVNAADPFPQYICEDCQNMLNSFFTFYRVCSDTDLRLRQHYAKVVKSGGLTHTKEEQLHYFKENSTEGSEPFTNCIIKSEPLSEDECHDGWAVANGLDTVTSGTDNYSSEESNNSAFKVSSKIKNLPIQISDAYSLDTWNEPDHDFVAVKTEMDDTNLNIASDGKLCIANSDLTTHLSHAMESQNKNYSKGEGNKYPVEMEMEIVEEEELNDDTPLAQYLSRKIIGISNRNFIFRRYTNSNSLPKAKSILKNCDKPKQLRKNYQCHICQASFRRMWDLQTHGDTHLAMEERHFSCCVCPEMFSLMKFRDTHELTHKDEGTLQCKECIVTCPSLYDLRKHVRIHQDALKCGCGLSFPSEAKFHKHKLTKHKTALQCDHCRKQFLYRGSFENHMRSCRVTNLSQDMREIKEVTCKTCGLQVKSSHLDVHHQVVHQSMQTSTTSNSSKGETVSEENLVLLRRQTQVPPRETFEPQFTCKSCGIAFALEKELICHEASVHFEKVNVFPPGTFMCNFCGIIFAHRSELQNHKTRVHLAGREIRLETLQPPSVCRASTPTPTSNFVCGPCEINFPHKGALICHQAFYHRVEMNKNVAQATSFTCEICLTIFARKDRYIIHKESHKGLHRPVMQ